jgi:prepilin-type N-terminal cleavage/methylation domain-containing protein
MKYTGFSLIELLVVIAIVSILAALALPSYRTYSAKAQVAKAVAVVNDVNNSIIESYNKGKWSCGVTSTYTYGGTTYSVNGSFAALPGASNILSGIIIGSSYGGYSCNGKVIATVQAAITGLPSTSGYEVVCIIVTDPAGTTRPVCGVWDGTFTWQVTPAYLPPGWNCLLASLTKVSGGACTNAALS